jgi:CYTH domain-containing protein
MIERERTYLLKHLPKDLANFPKEELIDLYIPKSAPHPHIRVRKVGDKMYITKKTDVSGADASVKQETTILLDKHEYKGFMTAEGKLLSKIRYQYSWKGRMAELDVFQGDLFGLAMIDFEFEQQEELEKFEMPDFCLAEVTQDKAIAGGLLAGKKYEEIQPILKKYGYHAVLF